LRSYYFFECCSPSYESFIFILLWTFPWWQYRYHTHLIHVFGYYFYFFLFYPLIFCIKTLYSIFIFLWTFSWHQYRYITHLYTLCIIHSTLYLFMNIFVLVISIPVSQVKIWNYMYCNSSSTIDLQYNSNQICNFSFMMCCFLFWSYYHL
jgi:hypothetical protein